MEIPYTVESRPDTGLNNGSSYYSRYEYKSMLQLVSVDSTAGTLTKYGTIDHSDMYNNDGSRYWRWRDVRRSIFMGDYIYAISDRGVTVSKLADLSLAAKVQLRGDQDDPYWWW